MAATAPKHIAANVALQRELAALPDLPREVLIDRWRDLHGSPPPSRFSARLMGMAVAYRLQEQALGSLKIATRRKLEQAALAIEEGRSPPGAAPRIKPGTRLLREWQGLTHEVIVLEDGVEYRGRTWRPRLLRSQGPPS